MILNFVAKKLYLFLVINLAGLTPVERRKVLSKQRRARRRKKRLEEAEVARLEKGNPVGVGFIFLICCLGFCFQD